MLLCRGSVPSPSLFLYNRVIVMVFHFLLLVTLSVQCLDLEVDVDKSTLRGRTSMWLRHLPNPSANGRFDYDSYPAEVALHCRQSKVLLTKVLYCKEVSRLVSTLI